MRSRLPLISLTVLSSLLVGCGGDAASTPTSIATTGPAPVTSEPDETATSVPVAPSEPAVVVGNGYRYTAPIGWLQYDEVPEGSDTVANAVGDDDGFVDNVNVLLAPVGLIAPGMAERYGREDLVSAGAQDVTVEPRVTVAGTEAAHVSARLTVSGKRFVVEQFYVNSSERTYVVTFSFSAEASDELRDQAKQAVLSSWEWT